MNILLAPLVMVPSVRLVLVLKEERSLRTPAPYD